MPHARRALCALCVLTALSPVALMSGTARAAATPGVADFDHDGHGDLAIASTGHVTVVYGSRNGANLAHRQNFAAPVRGLATADLTGDGYTDLIIGVRNGVIVRDGGKKGLGAPHLTALPGATGAVAAFGRTVVDAGGFALTGGKVTRFKASGSAIATGDVDHDGRTDLAVKGTRLTVLLGTAAGFRVAGSVATGAGGLAVADVNGDGRADVISGDAARNVVHVYAKGALKHPHNVTQNTAGVPGRTEKGDRFGAAVVARDVNGDHRADVVVGAPGENIGKIRHAGAVTVLPGQKSWKLGKDAWAFSQSTEGVPGASEKNDLYGGSLAFADLDGDRRLDLAVGAPGENKGDGALSLYPGQGLQGMAIFGPRSVAAPAGSRFTFALSGC